MQTLFCGSRRPDHLYQGEKTDPINAMIEIARPDVGSTPSTYHHAYPLGGTSMLKFGALSSPRPRARRRELPWGCLPPDAPRRRPERGCSTWFCISGVSGSPSFPLGSARKVTLPTLEKEPRSPVASLGVAVRVFREKKGQIVPVSGM